MACPKGFDHCLKACFEPGCRDLCQFAADCCGVYCFFRPGGVLAAVQQGDDEVFDRAMKIIEEGSEEQIEDLLSKF